MKKIFLTGYYGQNNFGDDLFQDLFKKYLEMNYKNLKINNYAPRSKGKLGRIKRVINMATNIILNDIIIFAGGSILSSRGSTNMKKFQSILAKVFNKKMIAYGVSYGPFDDTLSEEFYKKFIKQLDYITLRDKYSYDEVLKIEGINPEKVQFTGDIAAMIPEIYKLESAPEEKVLGISLCYYDKYTNQNGEEEKQFLTKLIEDISKEIHTYDKVKIFAMKTGDLGDEELARTQQAVFTQKHSNVDIIYHRGNVTKTLDEMNECSHMICMRLHAMIPAIILEKRVLAIEYHSKCEEFLNTIEFPTNLRISREEYVKEDFSKQIQTLYHATLLDTNSFQHYRNAYSDSKNNYKFSLLLSD